MDLKITKQALKFVEGLDGKQKKQVSAAMVSLLSNPAPHDSSALHGAKNGEKRVDVGEYRIVYTHDNESQTVSVIVIGKRNDDEVYKIWKQQQ